MSGHRAPLERIAKAVADRSPVDWLEESRENSSQELEGLEILDRIGRAFDDLATPSEPETPFDWGPLTVLERLDEGSFGVVYRALDRALHREVALKLRKPETEASGWLDEGRRLAGVRHPNVLTVHGAGRFEGREGIWTDLLEGESLRDRLQREGPLGPSELLSVGIALCRAVAALHQAGIVHGDIKPANVVRERGGRFVLVDLGAGTRTGQGPSPASQGSPLTSAPEVLRGGPPSPRSDLYSLGATLYQLVSGRPPFEVASWSELLERAAAGDSTPLRDRRPDLPAPLVDTIETALDPHPERRFRSAEAMERALLETVAPAPSRAAPGGLRLVWAVTALAALALASVLLWPRAAPPAAPANRADHSVQRLSVRGTPVRAAISPDGQYVTYLADRPAGREVRLQQLATGSDVRLAGPFPWEIRWQRLGFSPDGSFVRWANGHFGSYTLWEVPLLGGEAREIVDEIAIGPTYSPNGREAAFVVGQSPDDLWQRVDVVAVQGGERRTLLQLEPHSESRVREVEGLAWSPSGEQIVLVLGEDAGDRLVTIPAGGGALQPIPGETFLRIRDVCWSPGEDHLVVVGSATERDIVWQPWIIDVATGERQRLISDFAYYSGCSLTASGDQLATVRGETRATIWVVPLAAPDRAWPVSTTTGQSDGLHRLAWLDDQTIIYAAPEGNEYHLWSVPKTGGNSERWTTTGTREVASTTGGPVVFESWTRTERLGIYRLDRPRATARRLSPRDRFARSPVVSPDGREILYQMLMDDRMQLVRSTIDGAPPTVLTDLNAHGPSFSPDGRRIAVHAVPPESDGIFATAILEGTSAEVLQWLDVHSETHSPWASHDALLITLTDQGVANLYRVELDDPEPRAVTHFERHTIFAIGLSPDRTEVALSRGEQITDLLVIEGLLPEPAL